MEICISRHLLIDRADRLTGVIDWGDLHLGDAAVDLAIAYTFLPSTARIEFFKAYGEINPAVCACALSRSVPYADSTAPRRRTA